MSDFYQNNGETGRDGFRPRKEENGQSAGSHRQRFSRSAGPAYSSSGSRQGGEGYRPSGEGYRPRFSRNEGSQGQGYGQPRENRWGKSRYGEGQGSYRPRYNSNDGEGQGYRPRYNQNEGQGGYRPRYNSNDGEGGYRPRYNRYEGESQGGYRPRQSYNQERDGEGGYRPRFQKGGFQKRRGNYDPHAKYSQKKRLEYKEENYDPTVPVRLNKYLANAGVCSRRDADRYIEAGVVTVNGQIVTELGTKVFRTDEVKFYDNPVKIEKKVYVLLNKPKGYVTTSEDPQNRKTVMDLVKGACPERIYPVGRLDRNTTGVLLLTNDGDLASKLTHPKFLKKKIYHVTTDQNVSAADLRQIAEGITLEDGDIKADAIEYASETDKKQVGIEIHSGKNRIVRRIFESLGYHVVKLDRVYFAGLTKKNVRRGDWRYLTEKEVNMLRMGAFE